MYLLGNRLSISMVGCYMQSRQINASVNKLGVRTNLIMRQYA
jgi:hypothetical protein